MNARKLAFPLFKEMERNEEGKKKHTAALKNSKKKTKYQLNCLKLYSICISWVTVVK